MFYSNCCFGFGAWVLVVLGILALLTNLGWITSSIWQWWPVLLIIAGIYILVLKKKRKKMVIHHLFQRFATDERVQEKLKKIIDTVDEVVDKKLDEWHKEATQKKPKRDEDISGE
ncbi:MAG: LiaI-LiaF-like domain-containing protein [Patescibacteria group bacterium]